MSTALPIPGPLSLGELLDRAFRLYRSRFGSFVLTAAVFLVPYAILATLVTGSSMIGYFDLLQSLSQTPDIPSDQVLGRVIAPVGQFAGATLLMTLVGLVVNTLVWLSLTAQGIAALRGQSVALGHVVRVGLRRFWSYLGMMILAGLAYLGVFVVVGVMFLVVFAVLAGGLAFALGDNTDIGVTTAVGMFVMIICLYGLALLLFGGPFLYLTARWYVATPGIIDQEWGAAESLRGSWQLTSGSVLRCIGYLILLSVLGMIIVAAPVYVLQWMLLIVLPSSALVLIGALSMAASSILSVLWQPLTAIAVVLLYFDLRVRRESYDLRLRVEQLEAELQPSAALGVAPLLTMTDEQIAPQRVHDEPFLAQDDQIAEDAQPDTPPDAPPIAAMTQDIPLPDAQQPDTGGAPGESASSEADR